MNSYSQKQMVQQNCQVETGEFREPTPRREPTARSEAFSGELQVESGENPQVTLKPGPTSGRFKVTSSIVITMNLEFSSMCSRK